MEENGRKKRKGIKALIITICVLAVLICLAAAANYFMKIEPVNINTASVEELSALPGLSKQQAKSIVDYREENGRFRSAGEITDIKGISENTYNKIALYITAE